MAVAVLGGERPAEAKGKVGGTVDEFAKALMVERRLVYQLGDGWNADEGMVERSRRSKKLEESGTMRIRHSASLEPNPRESVDSTLGGITLESHPQSEFAGPQCILVCGSGLCGDGSLSAAADRNLIDYDALDAAHLDLGPFSARRSRL